MKEDGKWVGEAVIEGKYLVERPEFSPLSEVWDDPDKFRNLADYNKDWYISSEDDSPISVAKLRVIASNYTGYESDKCPDVCAESERLAFVKGCDYTSDSEQIIIDESGFPKLEADGSYQTKVDTNIPSISGEVIPVVSQHEKRLWEVLNGGQTCSQLTSKEVVRLINDGIGKAEVALIKHPTTGGTLGAVLYAFRFGNQLAVFVILDQFYNAVAGQSSVPQLCWGSSPQTTFQLYGVFPIEYLYPEEDLANLEIGGIELITSSDPYHEGKHGRRIVEDQAGLLWDINATNVNLTAVTALTYSVPFGAAIDELILGQHAMATIDAATDAATLGMACRIKSIRSASACVFAGTGVMRVSQHFYNVIALDGGVGDVAAAGLTILEAILSRRAKHTLPTLKNRRSYDLTKRKMGSPACGSGAAAVQVCNASCVRPCAKTVTDVKTIDEASELAYQVYLKSGYIKPNTEGSFRHGATLTNEFGVSVVRDQECGAIRAAATAIADGSTALPVERYFPTEVSSLRSSGSLVEFGTLVNRSVIDETMQCNALSRQELNTIIELAGQGFKWSMDQGARFVVVGADSGHLRFYSRKFGMSQLGDIRTYDALNGRDVGLVYLDLNKLRDPVQKAQLFADFPMLRRAMESVTCAQ